MKTRSALAVGVLLWVVCAVPGVGQARHRASSSEVRAALRTELNRYLNTGRVPEHLSALGLAVTFRSRRSGINLAAGSTRYVDGRRVSPYALWQIGSNTKAFTSVLVLQLEAEHMLSINDSVGRWLPQYAAWRRVTCTAPSRTEPSPRPLAAVTSPSLERPPGSGMMSTAQSPSESRTTGTLRRSPRTLRLVPLGHPESALRRGACASSSSSTPSGRVALRPRRCLACAATLTASPRAVKSRAAPPTLPT